MLKNILKSEVSLGLQNEGGSSLPMTVTFITDSFKECDGDYVSICVHFNLVTMTLVRLEFGVSPEIHKKNYNITDGLFEQPYLKIYEEIVEYVKIFFYEFKLDGRIIPAGFCTDMTKKQLNVDTAIIPSFSKVCCRPCQKDIKTYFDKILCDENYKNKPLPSQHSLSAITPKEEESTTETRSAIINAKFLGSESVIGLEIDFETCHGVLTNMQAVVETEKPLQNVILEILITGVRVQDKESKEILYQHSVNKISYISQDYKNPYCFGYVFGDYVKGHSFFGFQTEWKSTEVVLILKVCFQQELVKKKEEELNMKASQVYIQLKHFLSLTQKFKAKEEEIPFTLKNRVKLVENICWWLEGSYDDVLPTVIHYEESDLNVKIQELYSTVIEMKLAKIEEEDEIQRRIAKAHKKHIRRKKGIEYKKPDKRKKRVSLHANQLKVSQIVKEHVEYLQTFVKDRKNKTEVLQEKISKLDDTNLTDDMIKEAFEWVKSFCVERCEDLKDEMDTLKEKLEFLTFTKNTEDKNVQFKASELNFGKQHLKTVQRKPNDPIFEAINLNIPDRSKEKSEEIKSTERYFLTGLKVRKEEVEQLNYFISGMYFKTNNNSYEESNATKTSRKMLVRTIKMHLKEVKYLETALTNVHVLEKNLMYAVPNILQLCKDLYENFSKHNETKVSQFQDIISRIPKDNMSVSQINLCKEVHFDARNIVENDIQELQNLLGKLQSEENELESNVSSVCSGFYNELIEKRKNEFDVLLKNLDLLEETRLADLDEEDSTLNNKLRDIFLISIVVREKEIELIEKELLSNEDLMLKNSNIIVMLKDLFCSALELEKRFYEKALLRKTAESKEVFPVIYPLKDMYYVIAKGLKNEQVEESTKISSDEKLQVHTTLDEFLSMAFKHKQKEFEIPLNELKQDLEKVLSNLMDKVKEREDERILNRTRHNQALKILNSWKEVFLIAAELRIDELKQVVPSKIKNLKEEQATFKTMQSGYLSNVKDEGKEISAFWKGIFSDVVNMKRNEIERIKQLLHDPDSFQLNEEKHSSGLIDAKSYPSDYINKHLEKFDKKTESNNTETDKAFHTSKQNLQKIPKNSNVFKPETLVSVESTKSMQSKTSLFQQEVNQLDKPKDEIFPKLMKYKAHLKSLEHKRLKQPTFMISNWDDIIVQAFLTEYIETAEYTMDKGINTEVLKREYTWDELLPEANQLLLKEKELSHLLQTEKETYIPLMPWINIFSKAIDFWNEQINKELTSKQNENVLLHWKTKINPKEYSEYVAGCSYEEEASKSVKSQEKLDNVDSTFGFAKSMDMSFDLKELKETLKTEDLKKSSPKKDVSNETLWEDIFQDVVNVVNESKTLDVVLKKQDLKIQYQAARIFLSWNDCFKQTVQLKKVELKQQIKDRTMHEKLSKNIHEKVFEESQEMMFSSMNTHTETWTDKIFDEHKKHQIELNDAIIVKQSEMKKKKSANDLEFETKMEDSPFLKKEAEVLVSHAKHMFSVALNLRKAEVKAMDKELNEFKTETSQDELVAQLSKSINLWKNIVSKAVDYSNEGTQLKQLNKIEQVKSSEELFISATNSLMKKINSDSGSKLDSKSKNTNVQSMNIASKLPTWDVLFQKLFEIVVLSLEKMKRLSRKKEIKEIDINLLDWKDIFIEAVEQTMKENNPDQIDLHSTLEEKILIQPLPSWSEIFFIMSNYSKHGIHEKLGSDASTIANNDDLSSIKLLVSQNLLSLDNLLIATIEEFLKEIENVSIQTESAESDLKKPQQDLNHSSSKEKYSWIDLLPTRDGAKRFKVRDNLLTTKTKLLYPNSHFKKEKIPDEIMWKHLFPLAVLVWRKKMSNYLNFGRCTPEYSMSNDSQVLLAENNKESTKDLSKHILNKDASQIKFEDIENTNPKSFSINVSWREMFFAAVERKRKLLCNLINLKENGKDVHEMPAFSTNKVLDLPITPGEIIKAFNILKSKGLVIYNEESDEYNKNISKIKAAEVEDIEPFTIIEELRKILSNGMNLRKFEISILQQEIEKIESYPKKYKMASKTLKILRIYFYGAKGYRQFENQKIDDELNSLKDCKEIFSEYVDFSMDNSVYQSNEQQKSSIKKALQTLQKTQSDFEQKLSGHFEHCISDCKLLIEKRMDPNQQLDLKSVDMLIEKPTFKNKKLLNDAKSVLKSIDVLRKEELENLHNELELMMKKDLSKVSFEFKVFNILSYVSTFLSNALLQRNYLINLMSHSIDDIKQIISDMDTKVNAAFTCCKEFFLKAMQKRQSEITALNSELSILKSIVIIENRKISDILSTCGQYVGKSISRRNSEIQILDSHFAHLSSSQITNCYSNCMKYFSSASDKRNQEIHEIEALIEPLKKMQKDKAKDSILSSALDEALCNVFGIQPENTRTETERKKIEDENLDTEILQTFIDFYSKLHTFSINEIRGIEKNVRTLETFQDNIDEKPIQILKNFVEILKNDGQIIRGEIVLLNSEVKIFKANEDIYETEVNNVLTICHKYLTGSLANTNKEIEELKFQMKILSHKENEDNSSDLQYMEAIQTYFDGFALESETVDTKQLLSKSDTEVTISILYAAIKWRKVFIKTLNDEIKFMLNFPQKYLQLITSCKNNFFNMIRKRIEEKEEVTKTLEANINKENIEIYVICNDCLNEIIYMNTMALNVVEEELVRLTHIVEFLDKEKKDVLSLCEEVISDVISKREEEINFMNSELSHLQIMGSGEDTELLSHCKISLQNGIDERVNEVKFMKSDLNHWPLETEILPLVISCGKHVLSCLERKQSEGQNVLKLLKSLKEEGGMSILLYSPILESIWNKNNNDSEWLQSEVSKFYRIQKELETKAKRMVDACRKIYFNALENLKIEIEGMLQDIEDLQEIHVESSETDKLKDQQAIVSFSQLFMKLFHLKKQELDRDVRRKEIQEEIQRTKMEILGVTNNEVKESSSVNKELRTDRDAANSSAAKPKKKDSVYEVSSLTQLNPYFESIKEEQKPKMEKKVLEEFKDIEQKLTFHQVINYQTPKSSENEVKQGPESSGKVETFTNRVFEIKERQIEEELNLKRKKIEKVIMKRKSHMDGLIKAKKEKLEQSIVEKEKQIRRMVDSVRSEDSQVICSLKDILHDVVELKSKEIWSLKDVKQLNNYKDNDLEAQNAVVNLDTIFSVALSLKEEEVDMLKQTNLKDIERKILRMKKESNAILVKSKYELEEDLKKYREHEKSRALMYTGVIKTSKGSIPEEYVTNDDKIFPDIKAFEDYISSFDTQNKQNSNSENELPINASYIPFIRPYTYALHGVARYLLKLYKDEMKTLTKVIYDISTEMEYAQQHGPINENDSADFLPINDNDSVHSEQKGIHPDIVAILNPNTSMLMLGSSMDEKCAIALNLGHEFGIVYFEQVSKVEKWNSPLPTTKKVSIDVGLKSFTFKDSLDSISTQFDWDVTTVPICTSRFQMFISDVGILENIRFVLLDLNHQHLFCRKSDMEILFNDTGLKFDALSKFLSSKSVDAALHSLPIKCVDPLQSDADVALYATRLVLIRGALLTSICLSSLLERSESQNISVITNSVFILELPEYQSYIKTFISTLAPGKEVEFLFGNSINCGVGAALTACVTFEQKRQHLENYLFEFQALLKQKSKLFHVNDFIKLLENHDTSSEAIKLAYKYLEELKFNLPVSVVWAHYFMNGQYKEAEKLFKQTPVSLKEVQHLICQEIHLTENLDLFKVYADFIKMNCSDKRLKAKIYRCLFDILVNKMLYVQAMSLVQDMIEMEISLENLKYSALTKLHDFWLKHPSKFENVSTFTLPAQETYSSSSDSDCE